MNFYPADAGAWRRLILWPSVIYALLFLLFEYGGLDMAVSAAFYGPAQGTFPLRNNFWMREVLHDGARQLLAVLAAGLLALWALSWHAARLRPHRRALAYLIVSITVSLVLVQQLKLHTNVDCPWNIAGLGGDRPHVALFSDRPDALPPGRCFPGGHSSGGFALLAFYFVARGPRRAWLLPPGLIVGTVFALDQWARGAHFPSHDLTSAYLGWMTALVLAKLFDRAGKQT
ncbi:MAG: phosphatase PAP2 family protein [Thiobacillus sp.]